MAVQEQSKRTAEPIVYLGKTMSDMKLGMLSKKIDYLYQENRSIEQFQQSMREEMENMKRAKSLSLELH